MEVVSRKLFIFEMVLLIGVLFLSIVGVGITDVSAVKSYYYWIALTLLFGISSVILVWLHERKREDESLSTLIVAQIFHWIGVIFAILIIFSMLKSGRLNYENSGLIMMLVLGLAIFLDGYHISWRFRIVGLFIMFSTIFVAYIEAYIWIISILALVIALILLFVKREAYSLKNLKKL